MWEKRSTSTAFFNIVVGSEVSRKPSDFCPRNLVFIHFYGSPPLKSIAAGYYRASTEKYTVPSKRVSKHYFLYKNETVTPNNDDDCNPKFNNFDIFHYWPHWGSPRLVSQSSRPLSHSSRLLSRYRTGNNKIEKFRSRAVQNIQNYQKRSSNDGEP